MSSRTRRLGVAICVAWGAVVLPACSSEDTAAAPGCEGNRNCPSDQVCSIDSATCEPFADGRVVGRFTCRPVPASSNDETIGATDVIAFYRGGQVVLSAAALCTLEGGLMQVEILEDPFYSANSHGLYIRVYEADVAQGNVTVMLGPSSDKYAPRQGHVRKFAGSTDVVDAWLSSGRLVMNEPVVEGEMTTGAVDAQLVLP